MSFDNKFLNVFCIHGHFYQPPRENPWLEEVLKQEGAEPYHDWNERIYRECYLPNAFARLLDASNKIKKMTNNYKYISFNFGPTLLRWLDKHHPDFIRLLKEADIYNRNLWGVGNAIAQAHSHIILPLAKEEDIKTQIEWGILDFEYYYGRKPEGMWLPETAVDLRTLRVMADKGISFTILAPWQCDYIKLKDGRWIKAETGSLDTTKPYKVDLGDGKYIHVFFYNGIISPEVAFGKVLSNGDVLFERIKSFFDGGFSEPRLLLIACDGETFGHHHKFAEMALARAIELSLSGKSNCEFMPLYAFLKTHPVLWEAKIKENTSWSCPHGLGRWLKDCGCKTGGKEGWHQRWRAPLREAMDYLADKIDYFFYGKAEKLFKDIIEAKNKYWRYIIDKEYKKEFIGKFITDGKNNLKVSTALKWLELQRMKMYSYTSCGWFFSDISGIETVQILSYASRAIMLLRELAGFDAEPEFLKILKSAKGNTEEYPNGEVVYRKKVLPLVFDKKRTLSFLSIMAGKDSNKTKLYVFKVKNNLQFKEKVGTFDIFAGRLDVEDERTTEVYHCFYLLIDDSALERCVYITEQNPDLNSLKEAVKKQSILFLLDCAKNLFKAPPIDITALPVDKKIEIVEDLFNEREQLFLNAASKFYLENIKLFHFARKHKMKIPEFMLETARFVLSKRLYFVLEANIDYNIDAALLLEEAKEIGVALDFDGIGNMLRDKALLLVDSCLNGDITLEELSLKLKKIIDLIDLFSLDVDLWEVQNAFYRLILRYWFERAILSEVGTTLGFSEKLFKG